jgi:hypothetical protein
MSRAVGWLVLAAVLALPAGCGGGPERHHVSGQVLYDGKPVPAGEIYFDPDSAKGNDGPQGFARIKDGRYDTRQGGVAAAPGPQVVRILGFDGRVRPEADQLLGRKLFDEHKATAEIPSRGDAAIDFKIPAQGPSKK